jgi:hypothetical protein
MAYAFGAGTLTYNSLPVGTLQEVSIDVSFNIVTLMGALQFPVAIAKGPGSVKGSARFGNIDTDIMASITNTAMGPPAAETTLEWEVSTGAQNLTITLHNVLLSSWKIGGGNDRFALTDISFEAVAAAASPYNVLTVALAAP